MSETHSETSSGSSALNDKKREILPKKGLVYYEDEPRFVFCKPKLMPLKSITLEKLDRMQAEARERVKTAAASS